MIISMVIPDLYSFFLKGIIIVHEIKIFFEVFYIRIINTLFILKRVPIATNSRNMSCIILSQIGITNNRAYFLEVTSKLAIR